MQRLFTAAIPASLRSASPPRSRRRATKPLIALSALALPACVNVSAEMLAPQKHEPVPVDSVRVFVAESELEDQDLEWESVAVLFARGSADWTSERGMLRKLREEAGKRGANGIILGEMKEPGFGERLFLGSGAARKSQVAAIRWWERPLPVDEVLELLEALLEDVLAAQHRYRERYNTFAADPSDLLIDREESGDLRITSADSLGFGAVAEHVRLRDVRCAIHIGPDEYRVLEGSRPGEVACERR